MWIPFLTNFYLCWTSLGTPRLCPAKTKCVDIHNLIFAVWSTRPSWGSAEGALWIWESWSLLYQLNVSADLEYYTLFFFGFSLYLYYYCPLGIVVCCSAAGFIERFFSQAQEAKYSILRKECWLPSSKRLGTLISISNLLHMGKTNSYCNIFTQRLSGLGSFPIT